MPLPVSNNNQRLEHGLWRALTRLDGFEFPSQPSLTGAQLKSFEKAITSKGSWRHLTQEQLALRVTAIFVTARRVYESENDPASNPSFYASVAKKLSNRRFKDHDIFREIINIYADGLKSVANRSANHVFVDRRSATAALSVASWIELTEETVISITTKEPVSLQDGTAQTQSRKRRAESIDDGCDKQEAEARKIELKNLVAARDHARHQLAQAEMEIRVLTARAETDARVAQQAMERNSQELSESKAKQYGYLKEIERTGKELDKSKAKQERYLKALKAAQRDNQEMLVNLKRRCDEDASKYFALAEAEWRSAVRELANARQEHDQSRKTLAECADVIRSLNTKLNGQNHDF
ncbi:hypothetical protein F4802DRAFT_473925 [Xylaria palmicola]|nr:hypothetical protein F4802DRAFT_473925 [Xylaria palmicola]